MGNNMIEIKNKKASYDYFIEEEIECGIVLKGTEIKSIRNGQANIKDCYAIVKNNEVFLLNMYIAKYNDASIFNHDERRTRKLLLNKKEILKLRDKVEISGYTLVPIKLYFKGNRAKILLGVCKGKKNYDKRESIKEKDVKRDIEKTLKNK
ncbi:MAG: SsrA-binding protein SmpB [Bacilli bacterium]|nr:SsrA-binding protein SmpB [Bacilli bacterium]